MNFQDIKNDLIQNPAVKAEYDKLTSEYATIKAILNARKKCHQSNRCPSSKTGRGHGYGAKS